MFSLLLLLSLILVGLGYWVHVPILGIIGFTLLFILSVFVVLPNKLQFESGTVSNVTGNTTALVYQYAYYNDNTTHYFGYFLAIISAVMFWLVMVSPGYNHEAD